MYARKLSALKSGAAGLWGVHVSENRRRVRILKIRQSMESDLDEIMEIYAYARRFMAENGNLRIDTHGDNIVMQNLLAKMGFQYCGIVYVEEDRNPRLAYEKAGVW